MRAMVAHQMAAMVADARVICTRVTGAVVIRRWNSTLYEERKKRLHRRPVAAFL